MIREILIMPYVNNSHTDEFIKSLFVQMQKDGTAKTVFCDGTVKTAEDFLREMKSNQSLLFITYYKGIVGGICWLNTFEGRTARAHFCCFSNMWGKQSAIDIGKATLQKVIHLKSEAGDYLFDVLTGIMPESNHRAHTFMLQVGCQDVGKIPNAIWNFYKQKSETGNVVYITRSDITDENI